MAVQEKESSVERRRRKEEEQERVFQEKFGKLGEEVREGWSRWVRKRTRELVKQIMLITVAFLIITGLIGYAVDKENNSNREIRETGSKIEIEIVDKVGLNLICKDTLTQDQYTVNKIQSNKLSVGDKLGAYRVEDKIYIEREVVDIDMRSITGILIVFTITLLSITLINIINIVVYNPLELKRIEDIIEELRQDD